MGTFFFFLAAVRRKGESNWADSQSDYSVRVKGRLDLPHGGVRILFHHPAFHRHFVPLRLWCSPFFFFLDPAYVIPLGK